MTKQKSEEVSVAEEETPSQSDAGQATPGVGRQASLAQCLAFARKHDRERLGAADE